MIIKNLVDAIKYLTYTTCILLYTVYIRIFINIIIVLISFIAFSSIQDLIEDYTLHSVVMSIWNSFFIYFIYLFFWFTMTFKILKNKKFLKSLDRFGMMFPICIVNQWLVAIQHQQESPVWDTVKKETCHSFQNSSVVISRALKTAWLWSSSGASGSLLCQGIVHASAKPGRHSLQWQGKVSSEKSPQGAGLYGQKSLPRVPDWSVLMQIRTPNPPSLIGPKGTALIG